MLKKLILVLFLLTVDSSYGQLAMSDSLNRIIQGGKKDTSVVKAFVLLASIQKNTDSSISYAQQGLSLAREIGYRKGEANCLFWISIQNANARNYSAAIHFGLEGLTLNREIDYKVGIAEISMVLQSIYREAGELEKSLQYSIPAAQLAEKYDLRGVFNFPNHRLAPLLLAEIGGTYALANELDSALYYTQQAIAQKELFDGSEWNFPIYLLATYQNLKGNYQSALENYRKAKFLAARNGDEADRDTIQVMSGMSNLFVKIKEYDSALHYAHQVVQGWVPESELKNLLQAYRSLANVYKIKGMNDSALKYTEISHARQDSLLSKEYAELLQVGFRDELKQQELLTTQARFKSRVQLIGFSVGAVVLLLLAIILWRSSRREHKSKEKIESAYDELKATQAQLIQSEKMASLGELTAGIAHEIQNPLNFVNNFSEVNRELLQEMQQEIQKGNLEEVNAISQSLIDNEEKINQHGKRADSIVKGMLQHSRTNAGEKALTDLNTLVDEYLRLSYHGFRARDKSFNVTLETDFDENAGKLNIIPQDIGRVFLNLFNNAFYAVDDRRKISTENYVPTVTVSTKKIGKQVQIIVKDNGAGIPEKIKDKIFQPFFTTKPTGQGTGLGLSLSYDIVKAHGGELKFGNGDSAETEFIISFPI